MKHRWSLLLCLLSAGVAQATTVRLQSERQMAAGAAAIVRGTVVSVVPRRHPSGLVVTDVALRVDKLLKGSAADATLVFTQLGGTLDGRTLQVAGQSPFAVADEVLVFLEQGGESLVEMGIGAGTYRITRQHGEVLVERRLGRVAFAAVEGGRAVVAPPPRASGPEPLAHFEARIAAWLAE